MPEISRFLGIIIGMYVDDHNPPHFHVYYNEYDALITIRNLIIMEGDLPARIFRLVKEWALLHQQELMEDWDLLHRTATFNKIAPLE
ncbi:hypothetical protein FACS189479_06250 [Spirochaetia bacterium]|nr:hypothetical protein FACS189479_06250 [Spirochaetia bacterium]